MTFPFPNYTIGNGYTCSYCGGWVPNGCTHSCPSTTIRWVNPPPPPPTPTDERIATALEKLVEILGALAVGDAQPKSLSSGGGLVGSGDE